MKSNQSKAKFRSQKVCTTWKLRTGPIYFSPGPIYQCSTVPRPICLSFGPLYLFVSSLRKQSESNFVMF